MQNLDFILNDLYSLVLLSCVKMPACCQDDQMSPRKKGYRLALPVPKPLVKYEPLSSATSGAISSFCFCLFLFFDASRCVWSGGQAARAMQLDCQDTSSKFRLAGLLELKLKPSSSSSHFINHYSYTFIIKYIFSILSFFCGVVPFKKACSASALDPSCRRMLGRELTATDTRRGASPTSSGAPLTSLQSDTATTRHYMRRLRPP